MMAKRMSNEDLEVLRKAVNIAKLHVGEAFRLAPGDQKVLEAWRVVVEASIILEGE